MTLALGVVGAGSHSTRNHGPALARVREAAPDRVALRAVCDLDAARASEYADRFGFEATYADHERMLDAESLDAVVAVTPIPATRAVAGDLLDRGVPTLVEKPPGASVAEADELRRLGEATPHAVSFNRRFNPAVERAREWLGSRPDPHLAVVRQRRVERFESRFVTDTGIHPLDAVCSFLGRPTRVTVRGRRSRDRGGETRAATVGFDGATADVTLAPDAGRHEETVELVGPGYTLSVDVADAALTAHEGGERSLSWRSDAEEPWVRNGTLAETEAFLAAVESGDWTGLPSLADAYRSLRAAAAVRDGATRDL
ncbi:MAG: Gfo/Idh/MocA family protein [Halobacteriaceae archaeon]